MRASKRAVQSHLLIVLLTSIVATALLAVVLPIVHESDHERCEQLDMEEVSVCVEGTNVAFTIKNNANIPVYFLEDGIVNTQRKIEPKDQGTLEVPAQTSRAELIPAVQYINEYYACNTKKIKKRVATLRKC